MKRKANANTWVLLFLGFIIVLTAVDIGRKFLTVAEEPAAVEAKARSFEPEFKVGDTAPDFTLPDKAGKEHTLSQMVKGDTLLSFLCGCAHCRGMQSYLATLAKKMGDKAPAMIGVTTQAVDFEDSYREQTGLTQQVLLYEAGGGPVMSGWKGHPCPRLFRISADRKVKWIGHSPAESPNIATLAHEVADELGFQTPMIAKSGAPKAPPVPEALTKLTKTEPQMSPTQTPMPGTTPPPPGAAPGHSADDGHGHGPGDGHGH